MKKHKHKERKKSSDHEEYRSKKKEKKHRDDSVDRQDYGKIEHKKSKRKKQKYSSDEDGESKNTDHKKSERKVYSSSSEKKNDSTERKKKFLFEYDKKYFNIDKKKASEYQSFKNSSKDKKYDLYDSQAGPSHQVNEILSKNYKRRKNSESESSEDSEDSGNPDRSNLDFSYLKYKLELNRALSSFHLIQDTEDFWTFVQHFEAVEKLKKQNKKCPKNLNSFGIPNIYDKTHRLNFSLNYRSKELFLRVQDITDLTDKKLDKFKEIITIYIDFKHKEKFQKLLKLRQEQANLPVAQYKDEIISAVKKERVVIIAGDTGCGKSTQVPQYLYTAGFGRIGN